ncbi:MAG: hypothetical protein IIA63_00520 [Nitrospinae bacterium]|nr:hypothetical protein [Nitrospinota bacterium]MCH7649627.1 hypothetical protein [Nitrospinota bacterium]
MVIGGLSSRDLKKLKEDQNRRLTATRKKRSTRLTEKTMKKVFKKFDQDHEPDAYINDDVNIDEHVKMNDSYMRTGWYVPKKK